MNNTFGYLGVGAAIYASVYPNDCNIFCKYILRKKRKKFPIGVKALLSISEIIPSDRLSKTGRRFVFKLLNEPTWAVPDSVPTPFLEFFEQYLKTSFNTPHCLDVPTLFDVIRSKGLKYTFKFQGRVSTYNLLNGVISSVKKRRIPDLTFIHHITLDAVGHYRGPYDKNIHKELALLKDMLIELFTLIDNEQLNIVVLIFSDHGMAPINNYLDVESVFLDLPIKLVKDYMYFLDSTMVRLWCFTPKYRRILLERIDGLHCGHFLSSSEKSMLRIDKLGREHGELMYVLDEGFCIYPDFFFRKLKPLGIHGYAFPKQDKPVIMLFTPSSYRFKPILRLQVSHVDIMPTILQFLSLSIPNTCKGKTMCML